MAIEWLNLVFQEVPFLGEWLLLSIGIVAGSIALAKWGNIKIAASIGLLTFIVLGSIMLSFGWIASGSLLVAIVLLALLQFIGG